MTSALLCLCLEKEECAVSRGHCRDQPKHCILRRSERREPYLQRPDKEEDAAVVKVLRFLVRRRALKGGDETGLVFIEQS